MLTHAITCKTGRTVLLCHNNVAAEWGYFCASAFTPSAVSDKPLIHNSQDMQRAGQARTDPVLELQGDIGIYSFWRQGMQTIFDVQVTDTDTPSSCSINPNKILACHEREKKEVCQSLPGL
jgi:hypothetical protein